MKAGGNPESEELGIRPDTSTAGGYRMGDETVFHGNYRAWLELLRRGIARQ